MSPKSSVEKRVKDMQRDTRRNYSAEDNISVRFFNIWHSLDINLRETSLSPYSCS